MEGFSYNTKMHSSMGGGRAQCYKTGGHVKRMKKADGGAVKEKAMAKAPMQSDDKPMKTSSASAYKRGGKAMKKAMGGKVHMDEKEDKALIKKELGKAKITLKRGGKPMKKADGGSMSKPMMSTEKSAKPKKAMAKSAPTPKKAMAKKDSKLVKSAETPVLGSPQASMQLPPEVAGMGAPMMKHGGTVVHYHVGGGVERHADGGMAGAGMGAGLDSASAMGATPMGDPRLRAQQRRLQMMAQQAQAGAMAGAPAGGLGAGMAGAGLGGAPAMPQQP